MGRAYEPLSDQKSEIINHQSSIINPSHPGDGAGYWTSIDECRLLILDF
jgi:hypothetical protein